MARGSAQNAKGNKANNQPASAKGAGSHLRANKGHEADFDEFEPLVEPSANRDIAGVVIAVLAIASFIAVISPATAPVTAAVAGFYHLGFGLGAYVLPIVILLFAATLFLGEDSPLNVRSVAGGAVVFIAVVSILSLMVPGTSDSCDLMFTPQNLSVSGGYIGAFIASALQNALGKPVAMVVLLGLAVVGFVIIGFSVGGVLRSARDRAADFAERRRADVNASPWGDEEALSVPGVARPHLSILRQKGTDAAVTTVMGGDVDPVLDDDEDDDPFVVVSESVEAERAKTTLLPRRHAKKGKAAPKLNTSEPDPSWSDSEIELTEGDDEDDEAPLETAKTTLLPRRHAKRGQVTGQLSMEDDPDKVDESEPPFAVNPVSAAPQIPDFLKHPKVADAPATSAVESAAARDGGADGAADNEGEEEDGLKLPPLEILHANPQSASAASSDKELEQTAESLQSTLLEFGRSARVVGWIAGPTVTTFKLQPGEGERVSKISSLEDDIALSLAAQSVRIFAPIPGTSLVGIEIPNRKRQNVNLGDVLPYVKGGPLELAIGRDAEGTPVVADLAKMPHLLIAGTTGSGKSVMINSIITTLLMRALPEDVRLIMVDPKRVELAGYNGLPHLYVPVVTEPKQAASALQWAVSEMERRLKVFERLNVRKISTYYEKQAAGEFEHYDNPPQKMPYLVIIIDELSDLMMVAGKDVEASIVRIAQLGRAAGIHLIVATQRPSSNVVTGLIKANITNRIAFNVATGIDSRVIIDQMGAEKLTGLGDMLFSKVDWGKPRRIQGCFVSDDEINEIVEFVKSQSEPDYHEEILSAVAPASMSMAGGGGIVRTGVAEPQDDDPLIWEAAHIVVESQLGSTSGLQRRLKVGYARAGRIMDMLEEKGVVGPPDGSKPREVLLDEEGLAALESVDAEMAREDREFGGF